ncbi:MAG TPA: DUF2199 domain-containing protein [Caulobacteraceae bacterium]|nr:DUF2199 domain-containing protein [Caulobacteraceae bacterium]
MSSPDPLPVAEFHAPAFWLATPPGQREREWMLEGDFCRKGDEAWFVRGLLGLPLKGEQHRYLDIAVWVSVGREDYDRAREVQKTGQRGDLEEVYGFLATDISGYPGAVDLKAVLDFSAGRALQPLVLLEPTDHPLAKAQRDGMTRAEAEGWLRSAAD